MSETTLPPDPAELEQAVQPADSGVHSTGTSTRPIEHHGRVSELLSITLANLFFKVITLGVHHFWAKSRVRRYLWSRTTISGDAFEYTGKGGELAKGFLLSLPWLIPLAAGWGVVVYFTKYREPLLPEVGLLENVLYIYLLFLIGFGRYSARKYIYSHTRWRGIRLGLSGTAKGHAYKVLGLNLLVGLSFGIYFPYMRNDLAANFINNTWIGDKRLNYPFKQHSLVRRYWGMVGLSVATGFFIMIAGMVSALMYMGSGLVLDPDLDPATMDRWNPVIIFGLGISLYVPLALVWFWYRAGEVRTFINNTTMEGTRFSTDFKTSQYVWLRATNFAAVLFTLGLAFPWAAIRTARYFSRHIRVETSLDLDTIGQSSEAVLKEGEGLAEVLDLGVI